MASVSAKITPQPFAEMLAPVAEVSSKSLLEASENQIRFTTTSSSRLSTIRVAADASAFGKLAGGPITVGVQVDTIEDAASKMESDGTLLITSEGAKNELRLENDLLSYSQRLTPPGEIRNLRRFNSSPTTTFSLQRDNTTFNKALQAANICSSKVRVEVDKGSPLVRCAAAGDKDAMWAELSETDLSAIQGEPVQSAYDVQQIIDILQTVPKDDRLIHFSIGPQSKLHLKATLADGDATMLFTLKPYKPPRC